MTTTFAPDPDHIDLDRPEASGIGRAPRESNITLRALCAGSLQAQRLRALPTCVYTAPSNAAVMLERMHVANAVVHVRAMLRTLEAIANEEGES